MKKKKGHQRSRLRVDPITLAFELHANNMNLTQLQEQVSFDPAEVKALRSGNKIHLDTLNRIAARLNMPPNDLLIGPDSMCTLMRINLARTSFENGSTSITCGYDDHKIDLSVYLK